MPFGLAHLDEIFRPRRRQLHSGITFHETAIDSVSLDRQSVRLEDGSDLPYDVLVVATGTRLQPEETEGLTGPGWNERAFTFYTAPGAEALREPLKWFDGGRLVVNVVDMPIKCPVAPLEFVFLADRHLRERGIRGETELVFATPLDGAFTKPVASEQLGALLDEKGIELVTEFNTGAVDGAGGVLASYDGRALDFDLLVTVPLHGGAPFVERSPGLGDALGFVPTDPHIPEREDVRRGRGLHTTPDRRLADRRRHGGLPHGPRAVERGSRAVDRGGERHPPADRPALAGRP
ncbi:MAG TPA: FAD/NAD(P)-binding oxidoreductase, partial [Gaiella sp.]